jgi:undecaprenyl-diphosphatase
VEDVLRAIVLGIVQGLSEFLPVSSSGHLIVVRDLFGWQFTDDLTFDVSLHVGTTVAVLAYFWNDWIRMARSALRWVAGDRERLVTEEGHDAHALALLILGSIPIAIIGFAFADTVEEEVREPIVVGAMLIVFGLVLFGAERVARGDRSLGTSGPLDALIIGGAQALALVPGVSRSGITITAGLMRGLNRQEAARFSFLLSTPAIAGAALLNFADAFSEGTLRDELDIIAAGAVASAIVGWLSIAYLMRLVRTQSFAPFVAYRLLAGAFCIFYFAA